MVEAIRYTQSPLYTEKPHVIAIAITELLCAIDHGREHSRLVQEHLENYTMPIQDFNRGRIDYRTILQTLQSLEPIPHHYHQDNIEEYNAIIQIINSLTHHPRHEAVLRQLCTRLQELISPETMPDPIIEYVSTTDR